MNAAAASSNPAPSHPHPDHSEEQKEQFLFNTSAEAIVLLDGLPGDPAVDETLPADKSISELKAAAESTLTGLWGRIRSAQVSPPAPGL